MSEKRGSPGPFWAPFWGSFLNKKRIKNRTEKCRYFGWRFGGGTTSCASLAQHWDEMLQKCNYKLDWQLRLDQECHICATERRRRNRVIAGDIQNTRSYMQDPFMDAPFVHPLRAPSYHAQHLRSIHFARVHKQRLLWVPAFDKLLTTEETLQPGQLERRQDKWLEYHERFTNGIPGLLPLVLDLPVRFSPAAVLVKKKMGLDFMFFCFVRFVKNLSNVLWP